MNDLPRRDFIQRAAVAAGAVVAVAAELRPDHAYAQAAPASCASIALSRFTAPV